MCKPSDDFEGPRNVVIAGAGPAGLLLTALLMQRNSELSTPLYRVTLVDNRRNFGLVSLEELTKSYRSWMLGLAGHGCKALQTCEGLYQEYCKEVGIELRSLSLHLGAKEIKPTISPEDLVDNENFIVDRNFIVAAIARFVEEKYHDNDMCTTLYDHKLLYVDYEKRRVLVRNEKDDQEFYMPYDLLVGCDGVRSVVREALVKRHSTFEMDVGDIFQTFKAVHVERPPSVDLASLHLLPAVFPEMTGIALPETGNKLNIGIGVARHLFDQLPAELKSDDPKVVAEYARQNFKAFELVDYDDFGEQWANQRWNRTGQVHCNFYHSSEISVAIMGDAAHATSPSIGMGMNTALRDAQVFYQLLQEHKDNLTEVLPEFSNKRVKEGNSLTDLAMHLYCMDTRQQLFETIHMIVRGALHKMLPSLILDHPQNMIGRVKFQLSDVYNRAKVVGVLDKHRRINAETRQAYFEKTNGMTSPETQAMTKGGWMSSKTLLSGAVVVAGVAVGYFQWMAHCM
ncbi:Kynurenine 3-monooxygenase [Seminavis robusta]|uniref:Kynurenine 3-monooxygenase n=1 Tax=Seminavis robusta TaxID=568900 RepID=A0A9N8HKN3_9STRA|nr:Kynurenine 3-monooxygenase [Seminavis robusta]|eukprot:Sro958_g224680.1 Kynurenine 3-monooxygenase (512) ;mRNA; f:29079-30706